MKKRFVFIALLLVVSLFTLSACDILANIPGLDGILGGDTPGGELPGPGGDNKPDHQHSFVDGKCECGEEDPNYVPPHEHSFVDGKWECGEEDPNYVPPHEHRVVDGKCERCGEEVIRKEMTQWFFKITDYAEELLTGLDTIDWPEKTKIMQKNCAKAVLQNI